MEDSQKINTDSQYKELMSEFQTLSNFAGVAEWSRRAEDEVQKIAGIVRALEIEIAREAQEMERIRYEQSQKSLVGRLFNKSGDDKDLAERIEKHKLDRAALEQAAVQLQEALDFTPKSPEEREALLKELRQHKKQLMEKRREITTVMRGPRTAAQQEAPDPVLDPAATKRRKARYAKDAELRDQEKTKDATDRQLTRVDKDILWVEKFNQ